MQPFRFSLEKVHKYRQAMEKQRKRELAAAQQRQEEEERLLRQYQEEREAFQEKVAWARGGTRLGDLWQRDLYLQVLDSRVESQVKRVLQAASRTKEQQELALQAMQDRKVLDGLKARRQAVHKDMVAREEQKHLDEVAAVSYSRRPEEP